MGNFDATNGTWTQLANEQMYNEMTLAKLNDDELPVNYDAIYGKLIEQISKTIYHKLQYAQNWRGLGMTLGMNEYPGILREIIMLQRKGMNFPMDAGTRPTTLLNYDIINDEIATRYHSSQFRWMYGWTLFDEELRRFSGGTAETVAQLTEMKQVNSVSARNMLMDSLRKKTFAMLFSNYGYDYVIDIDITDFDTLTQENAKRWIVKVDNLLRELRLGTAKYNPLGLRMQVPVSDLQLCIPEEWWNNVALRAFPDTFNDSYFKNLMVKNVIKMDSLGDDKLIDVGGIEELPTFNGKGLNLLNWDATKSTAPREENLMAVVMHKGAMAVEDNLDKVLVGQKDIEKLATPVRQHYWTKVMITDLLPVVRIVKEV